MMELDKFYRKLRRIFLAAWLLLFFFAAGGNECAAWQDGSAKPDNGQQPKSSAGADSGTKISPQQAQELFGEVNQILRFASKDSGLPIKHEVKPRLTNRDEVVAYLEKSMREDKSAKRVERSELVLKKFGLLPHDFDLSSFLVALLREQIAGYYDPKTKTMNLLDWVPPEQQRPVLAHELTHALQDQSFGLEKWMKTGDIDIDKKREITSADIEADETDEVKEAVVEGQAETTMLDYVLSSAGKSVTDSPEVIAELDSDMMEGSADSVEFKSAPIFLKESLTFPYRYGVKFVVAVLQSEGKDKAFAGAFANPPRSTRQIMEPQTYLSGEVVEPMAVPDFRQDFKNYERFDVGSISEFDTSMLVDQYQGVNEARRMYPSWRGGYYYAAKPKNNPAAPLGLLYVSRWASDGKAEEFAGIYAMSLRQRYKNVKAQQGTEDSKKLGSLTGAHVWQTEDGPVTIEVYGDTVMAAESLDEATVRELEKEIFRNVGQIEARR
jgi:hypothetical protein